MHMVHITYVIVHMNSQAIHNIIIGALIINRHHSFAFLHFGNNGFFPLQHWELYALRLFTSL